MVYFLPCLLGKHYEITNGNFVGILWDFFNIKVPQKSHKIMWDFFQSPTKVPQNYVGLFLIEWDFAEIPIRFCETKVPQNSHSWFDSEGLCIFKEFLKFWVWLLLNIWIHVSERVERILLRWKTAPGSARHASGFMKEN